MVDTHRTRGMLLRLSARLPKTTGYVSRIAAMPSMRLENGVPDESKSIAVTPEAFVRKESEPV